MSRLSGTPEKLHARRAFMILHSALWRDALLFLAAVPFVYYLLAILAALRFFERKQNQTPEYCPPASLLKPVRGVDFGSRENFASFCMQDYPEYEILFAVNDESDPAVPLVRQIMGEFPRRRIRLFTSAEELGANQIGRAHV